jgi:group I intron endonuclease
MPRSPHKYHFIYKTTNLKNGMFYIGIHSTSNLEDGYLGSGDRLRRSIRKNGKNNFKLEILQFFDCREDLIKKEAELVNESLINDPMCMNLKPGGSGGFVNDKHKFDFLEAGKKSMIIALNNGRKTQSNKWKNDKEWSDKKRRNMSESLKGRKPTFKGKKHTEETKKKISKKNSVMQRGLSNSQFGTCWINNGIENKKIKATEKLPIGWNFGRKLKQML